MGRRVVSTTYACMYVCVYVSPGFCFLSWFWVVGVGDRTDVLLIRHIGYRYLCLLVCSWIYICLLVWCMYGWVETDIHRTRPET
ncbi:hypothetical protein F4813DRAFT_364695 [Daldinia decipiens]|uniref:uncharacterized protein n=1 Tax=Daldinia decipiens TaxID=326647 RepID=UPI0020C4D7E7|nr:uncharacterized protein F4813DRAFT_364695 [Daldinia decipiens]KAI1656217.1 hypothetical protein F4813DRAFT_364695 [Daldinia decipiens]